jgi:crotonobetainyl-CoA:carnitine CoA-transferase CaiB-like acyl-CoA transferase
VLAALRLRDQTGEPQHCEVTLQGTGIWTLAGDMQAALIAREQPTRHERTHPANPIWNSYRCACGNWILLVMPQPDPLYWPRFCDMIGRPEWKTDPRCLTVFDRAATARSSRARSTRYSARSTAKPGRSASTSMA